MWWMQVLRMMIMSAAGEMSRQSVRKIMNPNQDKKKKPISYYKGK